MSEIASQISLPAGYEMLPVLLSATPFAPADESKGAPTPARVGEVFIWHILEKARAVYDAHGPFEPLVHLLTRVGPDGAEWPVWFVYLCTPAKEFACNEDIEAFNDGIVLLAKKLKVMAGVTMTCHTDGTIRATSTGIYTGEGVHKAQAVEGKLGAWQSTGKGVPNAPAPSGVN